jgi:hypothetical protein
MSSDKQIKANRLNAQQSTGPGTAEGKARVSLNAVKHGLTARQVVLPSENPDEFDSFRADLLNSLNPQGGLESALAEKIIADGWRLRRIPTLEVSFFQRGYLEHAEWLATPHEPAVNRRETLKMMAMTSSEQQAYQEALKRKELEGAEHGSSFYITLVLEKSSQELANLSRHEAALSRSWFRAMHELERLQARRAGEHVSAPAVMDVNVHLTEGSRPLKQTALNNKANGNHQ